MKIISAVRVSCILTLTFLFFYKMNYAKDRFFFQLPYALSNLLYMVLGIELNLRHSTFRTNKLQLLKSLIQFDVSYVQYVDENYKGNNAYCKRTFWAAFFVASVTISTIVTFGAGDVAWYLLLPEVVGKISGDWCWLSVIIHAQEIKCRYENLNKQVKNLGKNKGDPIFVVSPNHPEKGKTGKLYYINRLHYKLYNIINSLCDLYTIALLAILLAYICHLIIDLYYLYKVASINVSAMSEAGAILHACRLVTLFLQIVFLFYTCDEVCSSANIMPVLLHQYRNDFFDSKAESHVSFLEN
nr:unnamed protein product [Callosobruchus analis]